MKYQPKRERVPDQPEPYEEDDEDMRRRINRRELRIENAVHRWKSKGEKEEV